MKKRSQAALEFLMTYGWAILFTVIIVGTLSYYGVLNPNLLLPERCNLAAGFDCKEYVFNTYTGNVILDVANTRPDDVLIGEIKIEGKGMDCEIDTNTYPLAQEHGEDVGMLIPANDKATVSIPCDQMYTTNDKRKSLVYMKYKERGGELHTAEGEILARMENHAWPTKSMCERAHGEFLCYSLQEIFPPKGNFPGFACECYYRHITDNTANCLDGSGFDQTYVDNLCPPDI